MTESASADHLSASSATACKLYQALPTGMTLSALSAIAHAFGLKINAIEAGVFKVPEQFATRLKMLARMDPAALMVLDIGMLEGHQITLLDLSAQLAESGMGKRIFLTHSNSHISTGAEQVVKSLGFAGLLANLDPRLGADGLSSLTQWLCIHFPEAKARLSRLPAFLKTVQIATSKDPARERIQRMTGLSPEALAKQLSGSLDIQDRSYRFKPYPACFLGDEASRYLGKRYKLTSSQSVEIGNALQVLGLLHHAAHDQDFNNEGLFYRLACSVVADKIPHDKVWQFLMSPAGLDIQDRSYLGVKYPQCFVGSEIIDKLHKQWSVSRLDAWIVMHRFEQLGLIGHVAQERGFIDGKFFYQVRGLRSVKAPQLQTEP